MDLHSCAQYSHGGAGKRSRIWVDPFNIQIMNKPESEDEKVLVEE